MFSVFSVVFHGFRVFSVFSVIFPCFAGVQLAILKIKTQTNAQHIEQLVNAHHTFGKIRDKPAPARTTNRVPLINCPISVSDNCPMD